jgi:predicted regulator of Ras-like GTPase activity (Roadblock/LC7/MglB family)
MFGSQRVKLNQILNQLAANLPGPRWLLLLDKQGRDKASFPDFVSDPARISAMSVATMSLGQRITTELKGGDLRYALFGGTLNLHLVVMLSSDYVLVLGLRPGVSLDTLLNALKESLTPLLDELKIEMPSAW